MFRGFDQAVNDPAAGRFFAAQRAADFDGLARHNTRNGISVNLGVGVHQPRHGLAVRTHVRSRNVFVRADELENFGRVPTGHALKLAARELRGIDADAALGAAEGKTHERALEGHEHRETSDFGE